MVSFIRWTTSWGNASRRSYSKMPLIPHMCGIRPCGRGRAACSEIKIKATVVLQHAAQAERLDSPVPSGRAQLVNEGWIPHQELQPVRKAFGVSRCKQTAVDVVFDDFRIAADFCRQ